MFGSRSSLSPWKTTKNTSKSDAALVAVKGPRRGCQRHHQGEHEHRAFEGASDARRDEIKVSLKSQNSDTPMNQMQQSGTAPEGGASARSQGAAPSRRFPKSALKGERSGSTPVPGCGARRPRRAQVSVGVTADRGARHYPPLDQDGHCPILVDKCLFGGDAKQSHPGFAKANAPQTLTQKASAESCCDPQNLYLSTLLEISFENCSRCLPMRTDSRDSLSSDLANDQNLIFLGPIATQPDETTNAYCFLASDLLSYVANATIGVNGGRGHPRA